MKQEKNSSDFGKQDFNYDYRANTGSTYTYNRRTGSFGGDYGQQSYTDWKKTQKDDGEYNYFYKDARNDYQGHGSASYDRRGDEYQTGS